MSLVVKAALKLGLEDGSKLRVDELAPAAPEELKRG
jgi:hypothetical protein